MVSEDLLSSTVLNWSILDLNVMQGQLEALHSSFWAVLSAEEIKGVMNRNNKILNG